jgi:hypothetical protein
MFLMNQNVEEIIINNSLICLAGGVLAILDEGGLQ